MIQPVQLNSNVTFKSAESPSLKAFKEAAKAKMAQPTAQDVVVAGESNAVAQQPKEKFSISKTYSDAKKGVVNTLKGFNTIAGVGTGIARGAVDGIAAAAVAGVVGKAISEVKDMKGMKALGHVIGQPLKDIGKGILETVKFIPSIITKSPLENLKTIAALPKKFFANEYIIKSADGKILETAKGYLSGHKGVAAVAIGIGIATLAFRAIQGKIRANENNAGLDHKTNLGHV